MFFCCHLPLPPDLVPVLDICLTVNDVPHDVDGLVVPHLQMFPVLTLGGQGGGTKLTDELNNFSVLLDMLLMVKIVK